MTLAKLRKRLQPLKRRGRLEELSLQIAEKFGAYILDLNKEQLSQGLDIFGRTLGAYSKNTEKIASKEYTRQPKIFGENYNFEWSGQLFDGMTLRKEGNSLAITSSAPHTDEVIANFGGTFGENSIFGLSDRHKAEFAEMIVLPELQKIIQK